MPDEPKPREPEHTGNKYLRTIHSTRDDAPGKFDVYDVLEAFQVRCPALQHAAKKILCAGLRGKGDASQDLREALDALKRGIELDRSRFVDQMSADYVAKGRAAGHEAAKAGK